MELSGSWKKFASTWWWRGEMITSDDRSCSRLFDYELKNVLQRDSFNNARKLYARNCSMEKETRKGHLGDMEFMREVISSIGYTSKTTDGCSMVRKEWVFKPVKPEEHRGSIGIFGLE